MKTRLLLFLALILGGASIVPNCNAGIVYPQAPPGAEQSASNCLNLNFLKPLTQLPPAKDLTVARPFGVYRYELNYTNLLSGQCLSATRRCAWHFIVTDGTNSGGLDLGYDEKSRTWPMIGWAFYPTRPIASDPMLQTLQAAGKLPQVKKEDYEIRYLSFLEIQFFAFWLHGKSDDIIIPVPVYGKWQDYRPYSAGEITEILKNEMKERLKEPPYKGPGIPVD